MGFATNAIHVGQEPDSATGAIVLPIYQTSTYVQSELGKGSTFTLLVPAVVEKLRQEGIPPVKPPALPGKVLAA